MAERTPYQYLGVYGDTRSCLDAIRLILTSGYRNPDGKPMPAEATLITNSRTQHAFVLWDWVLPCTIIPSGFASGYPGTGPWGLALALLMMRAKDIQVYHLEVDEALFRRLNSTRLSERDLAYLQDNGRDRPLMGMFDRYIVGAIDDEHMDLAAADKYSPYRWFGTPPPINWEWLDPELASRSEPSADREMQDALFKTFLVLKARLIRKFAIHDTLDGEDLVNKIFGKAGILAQQASDDAESRRILAMRDLLAGLFKVFRNKYGHNFVDIPWYEAHAVLLMINFALKSVDTYLVAISENSDN